ncbi:thiamine ABC transporter substrate binding subunit [Myceligenerans pegani]|uniref:Thiamine ABC transporter substrate-binding protein n=1 Tax=Myceligenerans pegani TaxID=2776917 RepID=A0ABR9MY98_9MICO|nr:thiamine ABC transporter substrate-binding protein [Myceligenerans sp. TRM 65318]MBE1875904.1 thiamine ABC transporter substrate-binding protein [Myceligenerans sp. TRM 65318]MBE3018175.1 thiamine ABC transporter substrate-binding protein [Myceligenerans sp. TRM 65318]
MTMFRRTAVTAAAASVVSALLLAGCTGQPGDEQDGDASPASDTVTLVTHDSFALSDGILDEFEDETGLTVEVNAAGDAGTLANQLVLTKDAPLGDAVFGIDNTFASRVTDEGVIAGDLAQIDRGDVCINADKEWFAEQDLDIPETLEDLTEPEYQGLLVVTNPATSSPGLAFLLATYSAFGDNGFGDYWAALRDNDVKVVDSWEDAYYVDFSGADGDGDRPLVLSYSTSPAYTVTDDGESTTTALLDTCFRQEEYAGVLAGADNPDGAWELVRFLQSDTVQEDLPGSMYMYPADEDAALPEEWVEHAPLADDPYEVDPEEIAAHRDEWIEAWTAIVLG